MTLNEFIPPLQIHNMWVSDKQLKLYVRHAHHVANGQIYQFLDIASVELKDLTKTNQGIFTKFLTQLIKDNPEINIFVESIMSPALVHILQKFNFKSTDDECNNMYLLSECENKK